MKITTILLPGLILTTSAAHAQFTTDANCGALGYACLNGRHCSSQRCSPAWQDMSTTDAPSGVIGGNVEALDGKIAVFGGCEYGQPGPATDAAVYDPSNDSWSSMGAPGTPRQYALAASGNGGVYVFGGLTGCYDPYSVDDTLEYVGSPASSWGSVSASNQPSARYNGAMVWTGSELVIYGGSDTNLAALSDGGRRPSSGNWTSISCSTTGCERGGNYDLWSTDLGGLLGLGVRIWGGGPYGNAPQAITYGMLLGTFSQAWSTPGGGPDFADDMCAPAAGGDGDGRRIYYLGNSGGVWAYDRLNADWDYDASWPAGLSACASAAWSGGELFAWSGDGGQYGARYQPPAP